MFVSERINNGVGASYGIHVLDGQNAQELNVSCVPNAFDDERDLSVDIVFDADSIQSMDDWHPRSLCAQLDGQTHMFSGAKSIRFWNLVVDGYVANNSIVRSDYFNASIACFECAFRNISGNSTDALFYTMASIRFEDTTFNDIRIAGNLIDAEHSMYSDYATREFVFLNSSFRNIVAGPALLRTNYSFNDVEFVLSATHFVSMQRICIHSTTAAAR